MHTKQVRCEIKPSLDGIFTQTFVPKIRPTVIGQLLKIKIIVGDWVVYIFETVL